MKIALVGYGRMGRAVEQVAEDRGHSVVVRLRSGDRKPGDPFDAERFADVDVAVEFTSPDAVVGNIEQLATLGIDAVVGTTGWYDELERAKRAVEAAGSGFIYAANFSLGTQLFFRLARLAGRLSDRLDEYDAFVLEAHHRHKKDHPSGTARRLAEILLSELSAKSRWELGPGAGPVDPSVLNVTVIRAGENPGMHLLGLDGPDDRIELRHEARGRTGFARGAVAAAEWIHGRRGVFTIDDMLAETFGPEMT